MASSGRWLKHDVNFMQHHKVRALAEMVGPAGPLWHMAALEFCKSRETEGIIPSTALRAIPYPLPLTDEARLALAEACLKVRLWEEINGGWRATNGGWVIHNWSNYQTPGHSLGRGQLPTIPTGLGMERGSVLTLERERERERDRDIYFSSLDSTTNGGARDDHARTREAEPQPSPRENPRENPQDGQLPARLLPAARNNVCPECEMPQGRHLLECPNGSGVPLGPIYTSAGMAAKEGGCPSCGAPWGNGHRGECNYDPRHPLDAKPISGNDGAVMTPTDHIANLREVLRKAGRES
jgi:hypothetical protein